MKKSASPKKSATKKKPSPKAAVYDFTRPLNPAGGRKRRMPVVERKSEEEILRNWHALEGIDLSRDMLRNNPQYRGLMRTLRTNIVGEYGKLRFNANEPWYRDAQDYFNGTWARHADFIDGTTFRETLQLAVCALENEGDFVIVFDDGILTGGDGTGKICLFEADQICNLDTGGWADFVADHPGWTQTRGILRDALGRKAGVIVTSDRGTDTVPRERAFVLTMNPDAADSAPWRHVVRKFRLRQLRGVPPSFSALQTVIDGYEAIELEMQTAKVAASRYAAIKSTPDTVDTATPSLPNDIDPNDEHAVAQAAADAEEDEEVNRLRNLELFTGGNIDYLAPNQDVTFDPANRPNTNLATFLDWTGDMAGAAFGLNHAYARGRADSSYTAFRGDMVMTWMTFKDCQQFLEDAFADWLAIKVISHAIATGILAEPPFGWMRRVAWQYPQMPSVDESKEADATLKKIKLGLTTFREVLGPDYLATFAQAAQEKAELHRLGLTHPQDETASGAPIEAQPTNPENE